MKLKPILLLLCFFIVTTLKSQNQLTGSWTGEDNGEVGTMVFTEDGYVTFITKNETIGGREYSTGGIKYKMTYLVKKSKRCSEIDFIITDLETNTEAGRMLGIFQLKGKNKLILRVNFGEGDRPKNFSPKGNRQTIILTKDKS